MMTISEAKLFLNELREQVWEAGNPEAVGRFYDKDVQAEINDFSVTFDDIKNRVTFVKANYKDFKFWVDDVMVFENRIIVRGHQTWKEGGQTKQHNILFIYEIGKEKIQKLWGISTRSLSDYFEKA